MSGSEIRAATADDAPGIRALFERVFGAADAGGGVALEVRAQSGRLVRAWSACSTDEIVGNYAGWGMRFLVDGEPAAALRGRRRRHRPGGAGPRRPPGRLPRDGRGVLRERRPATCPSASAFPTRARSSSASGSWDRARCFRSCSARSRRSTRSAPPPATGGGRLPVGRASTRSGSRQAAGSSHAAVRDRARVNWRFHARPTATTGWSGGSRRARCAGWAALSRDSERDRHRRRLPGARGRRERSSACSSRPRRAEARRLGARRLVFWETPGGPGRRVLASLPGERRDAGFPMIARVFDDAAVDRFAERAASGSVALRPGLTRPIERG